MTFMENKQIDIKNKLEAGLTFKVSRFKEVIKKTRPHKHDEYFELIFLKEGEGFHSIEDEKFVVSTPEFYFLKPGQLHFWQFTSVPKGYVILFKEEEFDAIGERELLEMNHQLIAITRLGLAPENYPAGILEELFTEYQSHSQFSKPILHGLLMALFGKLLRLAEQEMKNPAIPVSLFERFQQLLQKEIPRLHKVNQFAGILNTTPQNLNAVCMKQTGRNASEIITSRILLEAKRYILHTENNINEIAEILSFSDTSNFVKFFKKAEGLTPVQFREKYFQ
jgi:AraC family transcriptional regulator, transcriptional activator of pobA